MLQQLASFLLVVWQKAVEGIALPTNPHLRSQEENQPMIPVGVQLALRKL